MVVAITTIPGPIGAGVEMQGTSTAALVGDDVAVYVSDPASSNLLVAGRGLVQFVGLWDVILGMNGSAFDPNVTGPGAAAGVPVRVQVDISHAFVVVDTVTDSVIWTYDPVTRLPGLIFRQLSDPTFGFVAAFAALETKLDKILNGVYTGAPP